MFTLMLMFALMFQKLIESNKST